MAKGLTDKQAAFCREYVIDFNATQAAIRSGYSKKTAKDIACQNLAKLNISEEIACLVEKSAKSNKITLERILKDIDDILSFDPVNIFDESGAVRPMAEIPEETRKVIQSFDVIEDWDGPAGNAESNPVVKRITKVRTLNKNDAIEKCMKYLRAYVDKVEHTHKLETSFEMVVAQMCPHCGKTIDKLEEEPE
jgi:phage terminase small subunit